MSETTDRSVRVDYLPLLIRNGELIFRENFGLGRVEAIVEKHVIHAENDYQMLAVWAKNKFGLTDRQLSQLFSDYKRDYDSP